jgi:hypothetical protein
MTDIVWDGCIANVCCFDLARKGTFDGPWISLLEYMAKEYSTYQRVTAHSSLHAKVECSGLWLMLMLQAWVATEAFGHSSDRMTASQSHNESFRVWNRIFLLVWRATRVSGVAHTQRTLKLEFSPSGWP